MPRDEAYLRDMLEAARLALRYLGDKAKTSFWGSRSCRTQWLDAWRSSERRPLACLMKHEVS